MGGARWEAGGGGRQGRRAARPGGQHGLCCVHKCGARKGGERLLPDRVCVCECAAPWWSQNAAGLAVKKSALASGGRPGSRYSVAYLSSRDRPHRLRRDPSSPPRTRFKPIRMAVLRSNLLARAPTPSLSRSPPACGSASAGGRLPCASAPPTSALPVSRRSVAAAAGSTTYGVTPAIKGSEYIVLVSVKWSGLARGKGVRGEREREREGTAAARPIPPPLSPLFFSTSSHPGPRQLL